MSTEKKQDINQLGKFRYSEIALANARIVALETQIAKAQQQEPIYQARMCVIGKKWGFWTDCNQSFYEQSGGFSVSGAVYQHEFRKLYAAPVIPQIVMTGEKIRQFEKALAVPQAVAELTRKEILEIMHRYSHMHQPGHYSDTEFDCPQYVIAFARAVVEASAANTVVVPASKQGEAR